MPVCTKCQVERDDSRFLADKRTGRLRTVCNDCANRTATARRKLLQREQGRYLPKFNAAELSEFRREMMLEKLVAIRAKAQEKAQQVLAAGTKECTRCGAMKLVSEFRKCAKRRDGLQSQCKACAKATDERDKPERVAKVKNYLARTREHINARNRTYKSTAPLWRMANNMGVSVKDVPAELLEAKRLQYLIKRHLKERK